MGPPQQHLKISSSLPGPQVIYTYNICFWIVSVLPMDLSCWNCWCFGVLFWVVDICFFWVGKWGPQDFIADCRIGVGCVSWFWDGFPISRFGYFGGGLLPLFRWEILRTTGGWIFHILGRMGMEGCHIWSPGAEFYNSRNSHNSQELDANLHILHKDYVGHGEHRLVQHATCDKRLKKNILWLVYYD